MIKMPAIPKASGWSDELTQPSTMPPRQSQPTSTAPDPFNKLPAELRLRVITFLDWRGNFNILCEASPIFYRQRKTDTMLVAWDAMHKNFETSTGYYQGQLLLSYALELANLLWYCANKPQMVSFIEGNSICYYPGHHLTEEILDFHFRVPDPLFTGHEYLIFEVNALWERMMTWQIGHISTFRAYMEEHKRLECYTEGFQFLFGDCGEMVPNSLPPTTSAWRRPVLSLLLILELMNSMYFTCQPPEGSWEYWVETTFWRIFVPTVLMMAQTVHTHFFEDAEDDSDNDSDEYPELDYEAKLELRLI